MTEGDRHGHGHSHAHRHGQDDFFVDGVARNDELAVGAGKGKVLFLDAFSGLAGDMLLASLLDLGVPYAIVAEGLESVALQGYRVELGFRIRHSIQGRALRVAVEGTQPQRSYAAIRELLEQTRGITAGALQLAHDAFRILAEAEANVHGTAVDDVHFHEVGAVDSIVDTVGACVALDYLAAHVCCAPLPLARGFTKSQHGRIPLPAPATLLCLTGVPTVDAGCSKELVTPTGACLVKAAATTFERWPAIVPERVGYGAGTRSLDDRPNLLRAVLGTRAQPAKTNVESDMLAVLEANLDDLSGEIAGHALDKLLEAGALDSWCTPIGMKKGRPAVMLSCLVRRVQVDEVARTLLSETSTLGVRVRACERITRPRRIVQVTTRFGPIDVKVADGDDLPENIAPEYESCRAAAARRGVAVKEVFAAALAAYLQDRQR